MANKNGDGVSIKTFLVLLGIFVAVLTALVGYIGGGASASASIGKERDRVTEVEKAIIALTKDVTYIRDTVDEIKKEVKDK